MVFASIPLIFAVQQIAEGLLWTSLSNPGHDCLQNPATYTFLFLPQVLWPFWVPLALLTLETDAKRRKVLKFVLGIGFLVSSYLAFCLLTYHAHAFISGHHIAYQQAYPVAPRHFSALFYAIATVSPLFISGVKKMWVLGTAISFSYLVTFIFYENYIVSVWCFFAAVISVMVFLMIRSDKIQTSVGRQTLITES